MDSPHVLQQVVIYKNPSDFPGRYVAREWRIGREGIEAGEVVGVSVSPAPLRELAEGRGLIRLDRMLDDDPAILEVWI